MKIVNRETFLTLPQGTIYSDYRPNHIEFDGLFVKEETTSSNNDWYYTNLICEVDGKDSSDIDEQIFQAREHGATLKLDFESCERDGMYETEQWFAIYSREEVWALIRRLQEALKQTTPPGS